jgi:hypothetical protein
MGTGRIGGSTQMVTAKDAGVSFRLSKKERKRLADAKRAHQALLAVRTLRGEIDRMPRLVKRNERGATGATN